MRCTPTPTGGPHHSGALERLEHRVDGATYRVLGRGVMLWRGRDRKRRGAIPVQTSPALARLTRVGEGTGEELAGALAGALADGALESAGKIAHSLALLLPSLSGAAAARAHALVVAALIMQGERERAVALAIKHMRELESTADGVSLLELLEVAEPSLWLPDGRLNLLACSRRRHWSVEEIAASIEGRPRLWLRQPELPLLFFSLMSDAEDERRFAFMNRFLALHGLPQCQSYTLSPSADDALARFRFASQRQRRSGPLVSVVVAARNAATTVTRAIDSLLAQSYGALEVLVGDDASDDDTAEVLRSRYGADGRVRLFRSSTRQGAYNVRNALAARARGELLAFHDADDLALPTRLATQVARVERRGVQGCVTSWLRISSEARCVFFKDQKASRLCRASLVVKKPIFHALGGFRSAKVGADFELVEKLRATYGASALSRVAAPLIFGLWSQTSATRGVGTEALEDGYRSPLRRLYSELVFSQHAAGFPRRSDDEMNELLRSSGNYLAPTELVPLR